MSLREHQYIDLRPLINQTVQQLDKKVQNGANINSSIFKKLTSVMKTFSY